MEQQIAWAVITVIVTLVSLIGVFVKMTYGLSKTLATVNTTLENLQKQLQEMKDDKHDFKVDVYARFERHGDMLIRHENELQNRNEKFKRLEDNIKEVSDSVDTLSKTVDGVVRASKFN